MSYQQGNQLSINPMAIPNPNSAPKSTTSGTPTTAGAVVVVRINVPVLKVQKALKVNVSDTVWLLKRQLIERFGADAKDAWNFGIFLHGRDGKQGKFLDERKDLSLYNIDTTSQIDFILKCRIGAEVDFKKQRRLLEDFQKGNIEKARERITRTIETNFWSESQESLLSVAVMNNDSATIQLLVENGAFLDFRNGDRDGWKTPLHLAAANNKPMALRTLLEYGAWVNAVDIIGLTPIFYAATAGHSECVLRLLMAKADTEIYDESGKVPLHQAALNNFDCIVALLIDFGANIHAVNIAGNTPFHVAATRNSKESTKWLLLRGASREKKNKTGKTPYEVAVQANCPEVAEIIQKFTDDMIVPPPPKINNLEGDPTAIVNNVLASLSTSIGGEYKPQAFVGRNASGGTSRLSMSQQSAASPSQGGLMSSPTTGMPPTLTQQQLSANPYMSITPASPSTVISLGAPPALPRKAISSTQMEPDVSENRKSMRKSVNMPPPPPKRSSGLSSTGFGGADGMTNAHMSTMTETSPLSVSWGVNNRDGSSESVQSDSSSRPVSQGRN